MVLEGNRITIIQDGAAADIDVLEPTQFTHQICWKTFEEVGIRAPFETAKADTFVKIRSREASARTQFLTVITPRRAEDERAVKTERIDGDGTVGVKIESDGRTDVALFATADGPIRHDDVTADARSCFIRRKGKEVRLFAVHQGQRLVVGGEMLFEADVEVESKTGPGPNGTAKGRTQEGENFKESPRDRHRG
jgi:hypothetical protein